MSLPSRLLGANPSIQVSALLSGSLSTPSAKGAFTIPGDYESIASTSLTSANASSISFTSIPATYKNLEVRGVLRAGASSTQQTLFIRLNNDSAANYADFLFTANGSTTSSTGRATQTEIEYYNFPGNSATANVYAPTVITINDYANTNKYKAVRCLSGFDTGGGTAGSTIHMAGGYWRSTSAVSQIDIFFQITPTILQYSELALYGVKG